MQEPQYSSVFAWPAQDEAAIGRGQKSHEPVPIARVAGKDKKFMKFVVRAQGVAIKGWRFARKSLLTRAGQS
ncbi:hypothetical protein [Asticcacaulis benevestitus]|uniref:hypothetical protein n=1 Tax=Asticcacaulis benevestitus TaxID=347481 RepID=UPI0003A889F0|nr:hypothetical protein [Asticcacaulis benevestitus]